jgi:hypothetical protein
MKAAAKKSWLTEIELPQKCKIFFCGSSSSVSNAFDFLCDFSASSRLCVKVFAFSAKIFTL